jgi:hypothetical protein
MENTDVNIENAFFEAIIGHKEETNVTKNILASTIDARYLTLEDRLDEEIDWMKSKENKTKMLCTQKPEMMMFYEKYLGSKNKKRSIAGMETAVDLNSNKRSKKLDNFPCLNEDQNVDQLFNQQIDHVLVLKNDENHKDDSEV